MHLRLNASACWTVNNVSLEYLFVFLQTPIRQLQVKTNLDTKKNTHTVPNIKCIIPNTKYNIPNIEYNVQNMKYIIPNTKYIIPNTKYIIPNTKYNIPNIKYNVQNIKYNIPNIKYNITNTKYIFLNIYLFTYRHQSCKLAAASHNRQIGWKLDFQYHIYTNPKTKFQRHISQNTKDNMPNTKCIIW